MTRFRPVLLAAGVLAAAAPAAAQVGHAPASSPYREISRGLFVTPYVAFVGGGGGDFGIGPQDGTLVGAQVQIRANKFVGFGASVSSGTLQRRIVDPFVALAERDQGLVDQRLTLAEVQLQFHLTGAKSWRRLAPYAALGGGLAIAGSTPADTSGYEFGSKLFLAPAIGMRVALAPRLQLRLEARALYWKLNYPDSFRREPPDEPGTPEDPNAVITDGRLDQWTITSHLKVGLSWSP